MRNLQHKVVRLDLPEKSTHLAGLSASMELYHTVTATIALCDGKRAMIKAPTPSYFPRVALTPRV